MGRTGAKSAAEAPRRARARKRAAGADAAQDGRSKRSVERRDAILAAALEEFSAHGFEAARLDDVARRAGIAKGTIYLYFSDKEALFQALVRSYISPVVGSLEHVALVDAPLRVMVDQLSELFVREIVETRRKDIIRLILSE